jgi:hypothetical protein
MIKFLIIFFIINITYSQITYNSDTNSAYINFVSTNTSFEIKYQGIPTYTIQTQTIQSKFKTTLKSIYQSDENNNLIAGTTLDLTTMV